MIFFSYLFGKSPFLLFPLFVFFFFLSFFKGIMTKTIKLLQCEGGFLDLGSVNKKRKVLLSSKEDKCR